MHRSCQFWSIFQIYCTSSKSPIHLLLHYSLQGYLIFCGPFTLASENTISVYHLFIDGGFRRVSKLLAVVILYCTELAVSRKFPLNYSFT